MSGASAQRKPRVSIATAPEPRDVRFNNRRASWRAGMHRFYAPHAEVEPHAAQLFPVMFDRGLKLQEPLNDYWFEAYGLPTVRMAGMDSPHKWKWSTGTGNAEGRGLYELWSWRFDVSVDRAAAEIWALIREGVQDA